MEPESNSTSTPCEIPSVRPDSPNTTMMDTRVLSKSRCSPRKQIVTIQSQSKVLLAHKQSSQVSDISSTKTPKTTVTTKGTKSTSLNLFGGARQRSPVIAAQTSSTTTKLDRQMVSPPVNQKLFRKGGSVMLVPRKHAKRHSEVPSSSLTIQRTLLQSKGQETCTNLKEDENVKTSARQEHQCKSVTTESDIYMKHTLKERKQSVRTDDLALAPPIQDQDDGRQKQQLLQILAEGTTKEVGGPHHAPGMALQIAKQSSFLSQEKKQKANPTDYQYVLTTESSQEAAFSLATTKQNSSSSINVLQRPQSNMFANATQQAFSSLTTKTSAIQASRVQSKTSLSFQPTQAKQVKKFVIQGGLPLNASCKRRQSIQLMLSDTNKADMGLSPVQEYDNSVKKLHKRRETYQDVSDSPSLFASNKILSEKSPPCARKTKKPTPSQNTTTACKRLKTQADATTLVKQKSQTTKKTINSGSHRNPEETPQIFKSYLTVPEKMNSARQLFKAKKLVVEKQLSSSTVSGTGLKPSHLQLSQKLPPARSSIGPQPQPSSSKRSPATSMKVTQAKTKTMTQVQAQKTPVQPTLKRRLTNKSLHQMDKNLPVRKISTGNELVICIDSEEDEDEEVERFQTMEKSPLACVPKVKICLNEFSMDNANSFTVSPVATVDVVEESRSMVSENQVSSNFYQNLLTQDRVQFKLPSQDIEESSTASVGLQLSTYVRQANPYQQGGGVRAGDGQNGGDESSLGLLSPNESMIPAEDCTTMTKQQNINKLEGGKSREFLASPRSAVNFRKQRKEFGFFSKQFTSQGSPKHRYQQKQQTDFATYTGSPTRHTETNHKSPRVENPKIITPNVHLQLKQPNTTRNAATKEKSSKQLRDFNLSEVHKKMKKASSNEHSLVQCTPASLAKKQSFTRNHNVSRSMTDRTQKFTFGQQYLTNGQESSKQIVMEMVDEKDNSGASLEERRKSSTTLEPPKLMSQDSSSGMGLGLNNFFGSIKKSTFIQIQSFKKSFQSMLGGSGPAAAQPENNPNGPNQSPYEESNSNNPPMVEDFSLEQLSMKTIITRNTLAADASAQQLGQGRRVDLSLKKNWQTPGPAVGHNEYGEISAPGCSDVSRPRKVAKESSSLQRSNTMNQNLITNTDPSVKQQTVDFEIGDHRSEKTFLKTENVKAAKKQAAKRNISPASIGNIKSTGVGKRRPQNMPNPFSYGGVFSDDGNFGCNPKGAPSDCLLQFGHLLTQHEKLEILSYQQIYFVGTSQAKEQRKQSLQQTSNQCRSGRDFSQHSRSPTRNLAGSRDSGLVTAIYGSAQKQRHGSLTRRMNLNHPSTNNQGYDTATGFYQIINGDHLDYRYETLKELGRGTFGQVLLCMDHKENRKVAVKISKNLNYAGLENCMREVRLLEQANSVQTQYSNHVVTLLDKFKFRQHMCLVFELLSGNDLYREIKASQAVCISDMARLKRIVHQVVQGLCHLKECGIVHCDLKPENLMYSNEAKTQIKIVDLGSACSRQERGFSYVCSRYYRAPEMVLTKGADYDFAVDMWSLGCITAELYNGLPLFLAQSQNELIEFMSLYCGGFDREDVLAYDNYKPFFTTSQEGGALAVPIPDPKPKYQSVKPKVQSTIIKEVLCRKKRDTSENNFISHDLPDDKILGMVSQEERLMIDFICGCLQLQPWDRMTCDRALQHPFIAR